MKKKDNHGDNACSLLLATQVESFEDIPLLSWFVYYPNTPQTIFTKVMPNIGHNAISVCGATTVVDNNQPVKRVERSSQ